MVEQGWTQRVMDALDKELQTSRLKIITDKIDINAHDWIEKILPYDAVLWTPGGMGIKPASHLKEKIYFLEKHMGKLIVPNFESVWHFESKTAQSFLFRYYAIPTPRTVVTFRPDEASALLSREAYPLVFKSSSGAAGKGVRLITSPVLAKYRSWIHLYAGFWWRAFKYVCRLDHKDNVCYWQEFVRNNDGDLRITIIGDKYAFGFWRKNRPRDFRASGSGMIDYARVIPEEIIRFCLGINKRFSFDSMAYDILFKDTSYLVTEICYAYVDTAIYNAPGYYELQDDEQLIFRNGHTWPEQLWVRCLLDRLAHREPHAGSGGAGQPRIT